jgi:hypothetical protein
MTGPPSNRTFFDPSVVEKTIHSPSGEKDGAEAPSVPASRLAAHSVQERRHARGPCRGKANELVRPTGDGRRHKYDGQEVVRLPGYPRASGSSAGIQRCSWRGAGWRSVSPRGVTSAPMLAGVGATRGGPERTSIHGSQPIPSECRSDPGHGDRLAAAHFRPGRSLPRRGVRRQSLGFRQRLRAQGWFQYRACVGQCGLSADYR